MTTTSSELGERATGEHRYVRADCPTCRRETSLAQCGDENVFRCIECKALYTGAMLAADEMLKALRECIVRFHSSLDELKALLAEHPIDELQDEAANEADERALERARAAIAKATSSAPGSPVVNPPSNAEDIVP